MDTARYKIDDDVININANDITPKQYEHAYRGNLYCEYKNCNAVIIFNERQKGKFLRYFSTKPGSNHRSGCPNEISHSGSKAPIIKIKGNDVNVSDKHINDSLTDAYNEFYAKLHPNDAHKIIIKKSKKNKKIVSKTNDKNEPIFSMISTPTTIGEGETKIEGKEPYIYKREISDIRDEDKNSFKEVHALVEGIRLYENKVYIDLCDLNGSKSSVYIGTPVKTLHEQEFKLLRYFDDYIKQQKQSNEPIICTSVGEIMEINGEIVIQIFNYRHIKLDNLGLYQIINKLSIQYSFL